ncbi:MAG: serine hydrolase [Treponema sp.]|nr:serine hydrolase [Treponema sp.]
MTKKTRILLAGFLCFSTLCFFCGLCIRDVHDTIRAENFVHDLTADQTAQLEETLDATFPERNTTALSHLPYKLLEPDLNIQAGSAILVDTATGSILYEKNADDSIPPASLTKIIEMYVLFQAVENNEIALDDIVPLPPQSWSENLPPDASRMHLGKNHRVTLRELMLGLAISSGNDASIAAAYYVCGNMNDFVSRMNAAVANAGLTHTHFVESSGYSERNTTTAREFATFARMYMRQYPESLEQFHSQSMFTYPQARNLPPELRGQAQALAIKQYNTNKLLSKLEGCDGLKTGYIDESGYNIAVTAKRNGTRFLSVTMRGPGHSTAEGNAYRVSDNMALFSYAFANFADYNPPQKKHEYAIGVPDSKQKFIKLIPACPESFTVPFITGTTPEDSVAAVYTEVTMPHCLLGSIKKGMKCGEIAYKIGSTTLRTLPLVADRDAEPASIASRLYGRLIYSLIELDFSIRSRIDTNS